MPTLHWIGKEKVMSHHQDVPYRVLEHKYGFTADSSTGSGASSEQTEATNSGNKIIHGDNLEALKSLLPEYEGKVKCIYIDPPYNTGEEKWAYNDNVNHPKILKWLGDVVGKEGDDLSRHDKWMCMMFPRLKILQKLLKDDGAIFISLDENEIVHARLMCDEIFGKNKFVAQLSLLCNPKGRSQDKYFATNHEYCLVYSKSILPNGAFSIDKGQEQILKDYKLKDKEGRYRLLELRNTHREFNRENRPNLYYPLYLNPEDNSVTIDKTDKNTIECFPNWNDGYEGCWTWGKDLAKDDIKLLQGHKKKSGWKVYRKSYATSGEGENAQKKLFTILQDSRFYTEKGQATFGEIFPGLNKNDFPQPKSVDFVKELINTITEKDSIILDSFAGSGTTAHAVLSLNKQDGGIRNFILIEMEDYAKLITGERIKKVISGYEFQGNKKDVIHSYPINLSNLKKADKIIEKFELAKSKNEYKEVKLVSSNNRIDIIGTKDINGETEGTGGAFDYYELGLPLFDENQNLNEQVPIEKIREYIWFSETRTSASLSTINPESNDKYLLGKKDESAYYFIYEKDRLTTLDYDALELIKTKGEQYVVYADNCLLPKEFMAKKNIIFKKIPRDITRF
jgi:adenine-specific DNA-methyltransferase